MDILNGFKVLDVTAYAFVPSAGGVLAHWGADVIKVEAPNAPDPMRFIGGTAEPGKSSKTFKHYSRGKRSIAINLASKEGRELVYKLAAEADVFLTSYLAPTRRKLGIDVDDIRKVNPNIIYARGSGHGPKGPDADRPGFDALSWWSRGSLNRTAMDLTGIEWPVMGMVGHGDGMSGLVFAGGICAALLHRERTGEAKIVDSSLFGTAVWFNALEVMQVHGPARRPEPRMLERPPIPENMPAGMLSALRQMYQTSDCRFIYLLFLSDDNRDYADLCERIELPELAHDPRFADAKARSGHVHELIGILEEAFAQKSLDEWKAILAEARGPWTVVQHPEEIPEDPQAIANGYMREVDYPDGGLMVPIPAIQFDEDGGDPPRAPDFAEHTDEILEELGIARDEIAAFRAAGTIA